MFDFEYLTHVFKLVTKLCKQKSATSKAHRTNFFIEELLISLLQNS